MRVSITALAMAGALAIAAPAAAQKKYGPQGVSDTEIKIGQTMPHSGPVSIYGIMGRVHQAYFDMVVGRPQGFQQMTIGFIRWGEIGFNPGVSNQKLMSCIVGLDISVSRVAMIGLSAPHFFEFLLVGKG